MEKNFETHFFLGANSKDGFYSLYDKFTDPNTDFLYIIKSGPGSGKSTFMRIIADAAVKNGLRAEYIHCSGDPDSLDGVYFPEKRIGYVDGTSPHIIEPRFSGSAAEYIHLGMFYDHGALRAKNPEIMRLTSAYKAYYARAYELIHGAYCVKRDSSWAKDILPTLHRRASGIISREIPSSNKAHSNISHRFMSAISCLGKVCYYENAPVLCDRVYLLDNDYGLSHIIIEDIALKAEEKGWDTIRALSPISPDITEHLFIPELSLGFISQTSDNKYPFEAYRHLRLDSLALKGISSFKSELKSENKVYNSVLDLSVNALKNAKALHDELEKEYNPCVDFDGVRALASIHAAALVG